ncbi:MAG: hypothetical protein HETSPECPRED_001265 [Heterodermia speciosa]|uniref:Ubiquitin-like domain-containing protein n=1 Tax=Heterodermia speciosa TaxID=116794 RepID=A0A8H3ET23_9LECA|nr:MAG: hypothetical protein HETSPECPRED_001265 [Heterodermia speciosa]
MASTAGAVRQFVAIPMSSGYSVETQNTKQDFAGSLQFELTSQTPRIFPRSTRKATKYLKIHVEPLSYAKSTLEVPETASIEEVKAEVSKTTDLPQEQ